MLREVMSVLCGVFVCILAGANAPAQEAPDVRGLLSRDRNVQRETAQALGDALLGENGIDLTSEEKALVHLYVTALLCTARDGDPQTRTFSRHQIERLWTLAVPALKDSADSMDIAIAETVYKHLSMMRSDELIRDIIERARESATPHSRIAWVRILGKMTEMRDPSAPNRPTMDEATSAALAKNLIRPFLTTLKAAEKDPKVLAVIDRAFSDLDRAFDGRWKKMDPERAAQFEKLIKQQSRQE